MDRPNIYEIVVENFILGVPKENIKQTLLSQGYSDYDIDRAIKKVEKGEFKNEILSKIMNEKRKEVNYLKYFVVFSILIIIFLGSLLIVTNSENIEGFFEGLNFSSNGDSDVVSEEDLNLVIPENPAQSTVIDCGSTSTYTNNCFLEASRECKKAKIYSEANLEIAGFVNSMKTNQEIKGIENGKCMFYYEYVESTAYLTSEEREKLINSGVTEEQINQNLNGINSELQVLRGKSQICSYSTTEFSALISKWSQGSFYYEDFGEDCTGELTLI